MDISDQETSQFGISTTQRFESNQDTQSVQYAKKPRRPGLVKVFPTVSDAPPEAHRITRPTTFGRSTSVGIRLIEPTVSRVHAQVVPANGGLKVRDAGSSMGTFINGVRIDRLEHSAPFGGILRLGSTIFLVVSDVEAYRAAPRRLSGEFLGLPRDVLSGPTLAKTWDQAICAARLSHPVLIVGESGCGKESIARIIHAVSSPSRPFVGINVAAIAPGLFESELFGHERGSFTGAASQHLGAFREASTGVLFLDEVGDLNPELQAKLLRAADLNCIRPVGAHRDVKVDVRLVAATSRNLRELCNQGLFRLDLYYRLSGIVIEVPPLRARPDEIVLLARAALDEIAANLTLSASAAETMLLAGWEGNVRALRHAVAHAAVRAIESGRTRIAAGDLPALGPMLHSSPKQLTEQSIREAMNQAHNVAGRAASLLGVSRATLYNTCKRLKIDLGQVRSRTV